MEREAEEEDHWRRRSPLEQWDWQTLSCLNQKAPNPKTDRQNQLSLSLSLSVLWLLGWFLGSLAFVFGQYTPTFVAPSCIYLGSGFFFFFSVCVFFFSFFEIHRNGRASFSFFLGCQGQLYFFPQKKKKRTTLFLFSLSYYWVLRFVPWLFFRFLLYSLLVHNSRTLALSNPLSLFRKLEYIYSSTYFLPFLFCNGGTLYRCFFWLNTTLYTCIKFLFFYWFLAINEKKIPNQLFNDSYNLKKSTLLNPNYNLATGSGFFKKKKFLNYMFFLDG